MVAAVTAASRQCACQCRTTLRNVRRVSPSLSQLQGRARRNCCTCRGVRYFWMMAHSLGRKCSLLGAVGIDLACFRGIGSVQDTPRPDSLTVPLAVLDRVKTSKRPVM